VVVTTSATIASEAEREIARQLEDAPRADVCRQALAACGAILVADSLDEALSFANRYATEHLSIMTASASADARKVRTAGTTFVGPSASVAFGDYMTGANHVLPTMGRARSFSGLSTLNYLRSFTIQEITPAGARAMADDVETLALAEGLPAHAAAARARGTK
jgi:histidinol dehydrogenase